MTTTDPYAVFSTKKTSQREQVPGRSEQVKNNAGGFVFEIDPYSQLRRFLTIGTAGGTFYVGESKLTSENGEMILALTNDILTHKDMVDIIVEISVAGRALKQQPALFALAIACQHGETEGKQYARKQITKVVRTGTHLFQFVGYLQQFGGWSRGLRKAVGSWYTDKDVDQLSLQLIKYRQREGFTHRDVLRLSHPKIEGPAKRAAIQWALDGQVDSPEVGNTPDFIRNFTAAQDPGNASNIPEILRTTYLPWEALPDSAMNDKAVWDVMIDNGMPINALVRQLPRLTNLGLIDQMGGRTEDIVAQLTNPEAVKKSRIHPFQVLVALKTYKSGKGIRSEWSPVAKIIDALDEAFYMAFENVESTGKRTMNCLDISASMAGFGGGHYRSRYPEPGQFPLSPREISAAMAMVTVRTEPNEITMGFSNIGGRNTTSPHDSKLGILPLSRRQRLDDVIASISDLPFGGTDCALPMITAKKHEMKVDTFVVYTDNETVHGSIHPFQALKEYRKASGIDARLVVVSCTPSKFSIADPTDKGMLDISGFDSATPSLIADFSAGRI